MNEKLINGIIIMAIALVLIFVSGQQGCEGEEETEFDFSALSMEFVTEAPPSYVNYGQSFPIYLDIKNEGGYDIEVARARFYLTGIGPNLAGVESTLANTVRLTKKTSTIEGGAERLKFAEAAQPTIELENPFDLTLRLDSCYDYVELTQASICVGESDSICDIEGDKITDESNTVGPIQVTSLTERIEGNKIYFDFIITNEGGGRVYLPDADCDKLQEDDLDERLKEDMMEIVIRPEEGFNCQIQQTTEPYATVEALEGTTNLGKITCVKVLDGETHLSPVEIILSYKYRESLTESLTILPP